ncbi:MAG: 2-oxoacid:acceptor oxidoreductase subunit alpha [wastewater metagenome]|nr:2-oxoacid:acceptor oxidoreductase subunit alpha [Candidatus Loosdrechtia aerotolerans]
MPKQLLQGNQAIAMAAESAGLKFFAGYPITPASEIIHEMVNKRHIRVLQMEDEIASINAIIGASLAGLKTMTATSGPGFSLMQESIGMAHMMEVPIVIVNVQRVGPSTGMPTLPAQGDVIQCIHGSHGDYFPIVFYPNSVAELYQYTIMAFNAAEESLSPVILLSDGYISHLYETITPSGDFEIKVRSRSPLGSGNRHFTGLSHEDSLPKTSDVDNYRRLITRLQEKQQSVAQRYNYYEYLECSKDTDTLLISYGGLSRAAYYFKNDFSLYRPIRMFPVVEEIRSIASRYKRILVMEMNTGQYAHEIERILHRNIENIPILGGRIDLTEMKQKIKQKMNE